MIHVLFSPFYAATFSMGPDGGLLIASAHERMLAWGLVFCILASVSLALWLLRVKRRSCLTAFLFSLAIPALVMPSIHGESIYVRRDRITIEAGPWFIRSRSVIDLSGLVRIRQQAPQFKLGGMILEPNAIWRISRTDGTEENVLLGQFFTAHRMAVAQYLRDRGRYVEPMMP